jgi:hypothetical protein
MHGDRQSSGARYILHSVADRHGRYDRVPWKYFFAGTKTGKETTGLRRQQFLLLEMLVLLMQFLLLEQLCCQEQFWSFVQISLGFRQALFQTHFGNLSFCGGVRTTGSQLCSRCKRHSRRGSEQSRKQEPRMRFPQQTQTVRRHRKGCWPLD